MVDGVCADAVPLDMACENACVYMEIGIQAEFLLIADMMKNIQDECSGYHDDEDFFASRVMAKDIRRALDVLLDKDGDNYQWEIADHKTTLCHVLSA